MHRLWEMAFQVGFKATPFPLWGIRRGLEQKIALRILSSNRLSTLLRAPNAREADLLITN